MDLRDELAVLEDYLRDHDLKMTKPRQTVLETFLAIEKHVTAEELYNAVHASDPSVGQATVFRTIRLLEEAGLARSACRDDGARSYEHAYRHAHHDHLRCVECGAIVEFSDGAIERAQASVYRRFGYEPSGHHLELEGLCPSCRAKKRA
ncbi:MAG: transcriptional repressor [Spirochaetaceae bacterium]|nr:transcriptional repressor [Spirochaetaceae bacterium]